MASKKNKNKLKIFLTKEVKEIPNPIKLDSNNVSNDNDNTKTQNK